MANNNTLKSDIRQYIYSNQNEEITGNILRDVLLEMVDSLGDGWTYKGVATTSTNPGTPDDNVFYIATAPGTYTNFGGLSVADGEVAILKYNGSWAKDVTGAATSAQVTQLGQEVTENTDYINGIKPDMPSALYSLPYHFDMTPDGTGYYSAGGVITEYASYRRKAIDITDYRNKKLIVRAGYWSGGLHIGYCFVKLADDTYVTLTSCVISSDEVDRNNAKVVVIPSNAVELQISWDYNFFGDTAFVMSGGSLRENIMVGAVSSSDNINFNVNIPTFTGQDKEFLCVVMNVRPIGDVSLNVNGLGLKPVYMAETGQRMSEKNTLVGEKMYFGLYDGRQQRFVLAPSRERSFDYPVTRFDMTPDGTGYYSAGGVITPLGGYNRKAFGVTAYAGKRLRVRVGHGISGNIKYFTEYSYVKLSDDSFVTLKSCEVYTPFVNDVCADVILPSNAIELQCSWDVVVNAFPQNAFIFYDEFYNYAVELSQLNIPTVLGYVGGNIFKSFDVTPDGTGYYSAGGVITPLASYRHKAFDLSGYKGKTLRCKFGYPNYPAGWCWIKYDNGTYARLSNVGYKNSDEWVFVIPENITELEASWDAGSGIVPYMIFDADLQGQIDELRELIDKPLVGKTIFLFGDSISSNDYTWYRDKLAEITGATVLNQGASGRNVAYQASNEYFQRLANNPNDIVVVLVGGNDSGVSGSIGTFDATSPLGQMGESVVQETDISVDYNGTTFIQAISHIIRKWKGIYWNFRLNANLTAHILDTQSDNAVVYPTSGTATEAQCMAHAESQGWTLGYNQRYVMMTTETDESKRQKLSAVKHPKMFICTTLPQRRYNSGSSWSNPENWERKRLACIECSEKYGMPLIDLAKEFAIDWDVEPYWPGQGYTGTSKTDNQGVYTMDGLHPNEFGYEYIAQIVAKHLVK